MVIKAALVAPAYPRPVKRGLYRGESLALRPPYVPLVAGQSTEYPRGVRRIRRGADGDP